MRITRTWTISLPPEFSKLAQRLARTEHRTKSELVREALRVYAAQRGQPFVPSTHERLSRVGQLAEVYRRRHAASRASEVELRRQFLPIRRLHDRLKQLTA